MGKQMRRWSIIFQSPGILVCACIRITCIFAVLPAEAGVVEDFAEESDETHTLWISHGDSGNGGNRKKFAWTLVRCP